MKLKYIMVISAIVLTIAMVSCTSQKSLMSSSDGDSKSGTERDDSVIYIAVQPGSEPFAYIDDDGCYNGFDIALAMKLCEELGRTPVFVSEYGDGLYNSLNCGTAEMSVSSLTENDRVRQKVDFTDGYITVSSAIVTRADDSRTVNISSIKNIPSVGVICGSFSAMYLNEVLGLNNMIEYRSYDEANEAFAAGQCFALFIDEYLADKLESSDSGVLVSQRGINKKTYSIAVAKGNSELVRVLNEKIKRFKVDGTLADLRAAYLVGDEGLNELFESEVKAVQNKN